MQEEEQPSDIIDRVSCICDSMAKGQWEDMEDLFSLVADRSVPNDIRGLAEPLPTWLSRSKRANFSSAD